MVEPVVREWDGPDYDGAISLWQRTDNIGLSGADTRERIEFFLQRNPGGSFVAEAGDAVIGTVLAGEDGRRGYIYHLAVDTAFRGQGFAKKLLSRATGWFGHRGIQKCHIMIFTKNGEGKEIWRRLGWTLRTDIDVMSKELKLI